MNTHFSTDKALSVIRLLRQSDSLEVGAEFKQKLKNVLLETLIPPKHGKSQSLPMQEQEDDEHQLLYRIKELVGIDARWTEIEPIALKLISINPSPENKARILEISVLTGAFSDLIQIVGSLNTSGTNYYTLVHPKIRGKLIRQCLSISASNTPISELLIAQKNDSSLSQVEYLFIYLAMSSQGESSDAYLFYHKYENTIMQALEGLGRHLKIDINAVFLRLATQAFQLRSVEEAIAFTERVSKHSPLYPDALNLVSKIRAFGGAGNSLFMHPLWRTENWKKRLELIDQKLGELGEGKASSIPEKNELNELIAEVYSWLPRNADAITAFSHVCAKHLSVREEVPQLINTFKSNILVFSSRSVDFALWGNLLGTDAAPLDPKLSWLVPVAKVHFYWAMGSDHENLLWEAKEILEDLWQKDRANCPVSWNNLQQTLLREITANNLLDPDEKKLMLDQVMVTSDSHVISADMAFSYLNNAPERCHLKALTQLQNYAKKAGHYELQYLVTLRKAFFTHLVTSDLEILAAMAFKNHDHDLAWRVMTIAKCRGNLRKDLWQAWQLSPENQEITQIIPLTFNEINKIFVGFTKIEKDIAQFLLLAARPLLDFALKVSINAKQGLVGRPKTGHYYKYIKRQLETIPWYEGAAIKSVFNMSVPHESEFFKKAKNIAEPSPWGSVLIGLLEGCGVLFWSGSILYLNAQVSSHMSVFSARQVSLQQSPATIKFLEKLDLKAKSALYTLSGITHKITDQDFQLAVLKILSRLAVSLLPSHEDALNTLSELGAPASVRWDLETFILSPEYESLRKSKGTFINLPVPKSVSAMGSVAARLD